jgi:hypothetical protein
MLVYGGVTTCVYRCRILLEDRLLGVAAVAAAVAVQLLLVFEISPLSSIVGTRDDDGLLPTGVVLEPGADPTTTSAATAAAAAGLRSRSSSFAWVSASRVVVAVAASRG